MDDISVRIDGSTIRIDAHARFAVARSRRHIALTNLRLCFPELSEAERVVLARRHFQAYGRSVLERGILWWASERRLRRLIRIEPGLPLDAIHAGPTILLCPHFVGLDVAGVAIALDCSACAIYSRQSNEGFDRALQRGRTRFKPVKIFPQGAGGILLRPSALQDATGG
jgi:KDO2-lipid IV(A) lauroyltransferase